MNIQLEENFNFQLEDYQIEHQGNAVLDISVDLDYKEGIGIDDPFEYPDFIPIANFIDNFLVNYPNETDFWEILNKNLVQTLLTESIPTDFGVEYNLDEVLDSISVDIQVQPGSSNIDTPRGSTVIGTPLKIDSETQKPEIQKPGIINLQNAKDSFSVDVKVNRNSSFNNIVGFYEIFDNNGGIDITGDGVTDINPGDKGYTKAALENRITGLDSIQTENQQISVFDGKLDGGIILAPFIVVNGTVEEALNDTAEVYFSFLGANSDGAEHVRLIDDTTFGFEDLPNGGDKDFNDMKVKVDFSKV